MFGFWFSTSKGGEGIAIMHCKSNANDVFGLHGVLFQNVPGALAISDADALAVVREKSLSVSSTGILDLSM